MKSICLILFSTFYSIHCDKLKIQEMWVYNYSETRGYTSGGAVRQFEILENKNDKQKMNKEDLNSIQNIIFKSKVKKLFPSKTGTNLLFLQIIDTNHISANVIVNYGCIRDFTNRKDYWITDKNDQEWLALFIKKTKKL
jgi:hypothetical protein